MAETVNQGNQSTANQPERTFTQTELNAIIEDRLRRERAKYTDYESLKEKAQKFDAAEEANKTELQKTELQKARDKANALQAQLDKINSDNQIHEKVAKWMGKKSYKMSDNFIRQKCFATGVCGNTWSGCYSQ